MVKIRVLGGTPEASDTLCKTCTRGHVIKGFRLTEQVVYCRTFYIEREILFPVRECTFYEDRRVASKEDMEEIAWRLRTMSPTRHVGFVSAAQFRQLQEEAAKAADAAADREELPHDRD
jgi:hypothetical protein